MPRVRSVAIIEYLQQLLVRLVRRANVSNFGGSDDCDRSRLLTGSRSVF